MKKVLLVTFCIASLFTKLKAQQYHPMLDSTNIWSYTTLTIGARLGGNRTQSGTCGYPFTYYYPSAAHFYTNQDTLIHSKNYKQLYSTGTYSNDTCLYGFLREDTAARKVYFQDVLDSPEVLLYNFSMQIGDSMYINFLDSEGELFFRNGFYTLDSITTFTIQTGIRRAFNLNCHTCSFTYDPLIWVESVGNLGDAIYPYSLNEFGDNFFSCPGFPHDFIQVMTCFEHNQMVYFDSCALQTAHDNPGYFWYLDSCDYGNYPGAVHELSSLLSCNISPNPVANQLTIQTSLHTSEAVTLSIINMLGEIIHKEEFNGKQETVNCKPFTSGIYFVQLTGEKERWVGKFIKE